LNLISNCNDRFRLRFQPVEAKRNPPKRSFLDQPRCVMLARVSSKDTRTVINALIKHAHELPRELYKSLTWDRGKEMGDHKRFSLDTDIKVFFCDPRSPWQRGSTKTPMACSGNTSRKGMDTSRASIKTD
jgi:hypothetical protein